METSSGKRSSVQKKPASTTFEIYVIPELANEDESGLQESKTPKSSSRNDSIERASNIEPKRFFKENKKFVRLSDGPISNILPNSQLDSSTQAPLSDRLDRSGICEFVGAQDRMSVHAES